MLPTLLLIPLLLQVDPSDEKAQTQRWMDYYAKTAGAYRIFLDGDERIPLEFEPTSILRYTNPTRERGQHGAVFIWKYQGRPEAVGTIWSIRNQADATKRRTAHEFHSLSTAPLWSERPAIKGLGRRGRVPQWRVNQPGIKLAAIPGAPAPSLSNAARLVQLRRLATGFTGLAESKDGSKRPLRMLSQPLVRYTSPPAGVRDGGLFAFVLGTDPELLLMIELRHVDQQPSWQFAAVRCTGVPLELRWKKQAVWNCEKATTWVGDRPYFFCVGVREHAADLPDAGAEQ